MEIKINSAKWRGLICRALILSPFFMTFFVLMAFYRDQSSYKSGLQDISYSEKFVSPDELQFSNDEDQYVTIATILKGVSLQTDSGYKLRHSLKYLFKSLVIHAKSKPVRLLFLTDGPSIELIETIMQEILPPFQLYNNINFTQTKGDTKTIIIKEVPRFEWFFIEIDGLVKRVGPWSEPMKAFFNHAGAKHIIKNKKTNRTFMMTFITKYDDTIYYLHPFYHKIFPKLNRLLVVDADVRFKVDPAEVFQQFEQFSDTNLLAVGNDLAPHYHEMLSESGYLEQHPTSKFGQPGIFQGLNVGVILYRLDRMRESSTYEEYLGKDAIEYLAHKYGLVETHLGAQDWFTLVMFDEPSLIYPLNCKFNYQLSVEYNIGPWTDIFSDFHNCTEDPAIIHGNGDSLVYSFK